MVNNFLSKISDLINQTKFKFNSIFFELFSFTYIKLYIVTILIINALNWLAVFIINHRVSQELVALHYNVDFGVNLVGKVSRIYSIPLIGFVVLVVNLAILINMYKQDKFISQLLLLVALVVNVFLFAATASLYLVNF